MPFDSEGNFTRVHNWEEDRQNDIDIVSDRHDEEDDNFANGFNDCMLRDGRCTMTGDLDMGNFKVKRVANGTVNTDAVNKKQLDDAKTELTTNLTAGYEQEVKELSDRFQVVYQLPSSPDAETFYFIPEV